MNKRLHVLLEESEFREIRDFARRQRLTVAEVVRQALRNAIRASPRSDARKKLAAIKRATQNSFPAPDITDMLAEIERGQGGIAGTNRD